MATTKIFPITATEGKALAYIADPEKTDHGRLIFTSGCSDDPHQASRDFEEVRRSGTGLNRVLSQHVVQSFAPGEITPERALQMGKELCERFLKNQYQYFLAVHTDKNHIHLHCIFNNVNMFDGRTFETHENRRTTQKDRSFQKLRDISDELCREHCLSVIENPETAKGKSYFEWDMNRQGLSWKARLKFAIDQVVKESENFEDFLEKCKAHGILADYNPERKIDLKFMLEEQKISNPKAKFTRAKTLGWYYETNQIERRIDMYKGVISYTPKTKIIETASEKFQTSAGLRKWADKQNMKEVSRAINILTKYQIRETELENKTFSTCAGMGALSEQLNALNTRIEDLNAKLKTVRNFQKYKVFMDELKTLSGRQRTKYRNDHRDELRIYDKLAGQLHEWYPSGQVPSAENLEKKRNALIHERSEKNEKYKSLKSTVSELNYARQALADYLKNERNNQELRKKKDELE